MSEEIDFHRLAWDDVYRKTLEQKSDIEVLREENAALAAQVETMRATLQAVKEWMNSPILANETARLKQELKIQTQIDQALALTPEGAREQQQKRDAQICRDLKIWQPLADSPSRIANDKLEQAARAIEQGTVRNERT